MGWTADHLSDLTGRTALVTGANSGIGFHTARQLARHGARVVLGCRNAEAGAAAAERVGRGARSAHLDLASMASIREFAAGWDGPLDLLVNNAGVMAPPRFSATVDGFELQFGTNHLGHFVLTGLLLRTLSGSGAETRVVTVSSIAHHGGGEDVLDANAAGYHPQRAYANSKLANLLFALQLDRELGDRDSSLTSTAAHPGVSATNLFSSEQGMGRSRVVRLVVPWVLRAGTQSSAAGARAVLYAATEADPGSYTGPRLLRETRGPIGPARISEFGQDEKLARRLWQVSEELTGFRYEW